MGFAGEFGVKGHVCGLVFGGVLELCVEIADVRAGIWNYSCVYAVAGKQACVKGCKGIRQ